MILLLHRKWVIFICIVSKSTKSLNTRYNMSWKIKLIIAYEQDISDMWKNIRWEYPEREAKQVFKNKPWVPYA